MAFAESGGLLRGDPVGSCNEPLVQFERGREVIHSKKYAIHQRNIYNTRARCADSDHRQRTATDWPACFAQEFF